jgi:putative membrane protein
MKTNKLIARILIMVIVLSTLASSIAFAEGKVIKEETVYVNLNNEG